MFSSPSGRSASPRGSSPQLLARGAGARAAHRASLPLLRLVPSRALRGLRLGPRVRRARRMTRPEQCRQAYTDTIRQLETTSTCAKRFVFYSTVRRNINAETKLANPAPHKILKGTKFCWNFVDQQNSNKIRKVLP